MEGFPYNGKTLNSSGSLAVVVYLPAGNATVDTIVFERNAVTLSGHTTTSMSSLGDISKVANLGTAAVDINIEPAGTLTLNQVVYFGLSETGMSLDSDGTLSAFILSPLGLAEASFGLELTGSLELLSLIPSAAVTSSLDSTGSIHRRVPMLGALDSSLSLSSVLSAQKSLGSGALLTEFAVSGRIGAVQYLGGALQLALNPTGSLSLNRRNYIGLTGTTVSFDNTGTLRLTGGLQGNVPLNMALEGTITRGLTVHIPASVIETGFSNTGSLRLTGGLSGEATIQHNLVGSLNRGIRVYFDASDTGFNLASSGLLQSTVRMSGNSTILWTETGNLRLTHTLSGNSDTGFVLAGSLSNNASIEDLASFLMKRRHTNREMTR